jgi:hypothetical protein
MTGASSRLDAQPLRYSIFAKLGIVLITTISVATEYRYAELVYFLYLYLYSPDSGLYLH